MDTLEAIRTVRATRVYSDRPLERAKLMALLEAGRRTGSGKNRQPWSFIAVTSPAIVQELAGCGALSDHIAAAPAVIVLATDRSAASSSITSFDLGRCCQNIVLAGESLGLASCVTWLNPERVAAALKMPEDRLANVAIAVGYRGAGPDDKISGQPKAEVLLASGRRNLDELVHWDRW